MQKENAKHKTAYIETKQTRRQNMLKGSQRKLFCCHGKNRGGKITYPIIRAENNLTPSEI